MVIELCRLTKDVKLSKVNYNGEEKVVLNNSVAIRLNKNNVTFIDISAWSVVAEVMARYFKKGDELLIKGELRNKKTKVGDKEIINAYIVVNGFDFTYGNKREEVNIESSKEVIGDDELPFN